MADFVQTMKDWHRMCKAQDDTTCGACSSCPMGDDGKSCMAVYEDEFETVDFAHIEQTVTEWAAEHPVVYPTWKEWLEEQRVVVHFDSVSEKGTKVKWELTNKSNCPIPADIAQKLELQQKEGV